MSEELPDVPVCTAVAQERVMVQVYTLPSYLDEHLHCYMFEPLYISLTDIPHVVIT